MADVFENFRNTCLKVYESDPAHFLSLPGLTWQACPKKTNVKLELLTDYGNKRWNMSFYTQTC